jgi:IclR family transcriptional regulator, acetate operon repressor
VADAGGEVVTSRLAADSGLAVSTIHRLVRTLAAHGYVRQLPSRRSVLGPRLIHLGERSSRVLGTWAQPHLSGMVDAIGETADLAVLDGDRVVHVAQVPSRHSMRMSTEVGRRVHLHRTGVGTVLLAQLPPATARELLVRGGMPATTGRTVTDPDELLARLPLVAAEGYALDDGEQETGVRCVAVPVPGGAAAGAIAVSGPAGGWGCRRCPGWCRCCSRRRHWPPSSGPAAVVEPTRRTRTPSRWLHTTTNSRRMGRRGRPVGGRRPPSRSPALQVARPDRAPDHRVSGAGDPDRAHAQEHRDHHP